MGIAMRRFWAGLSCLIFLLSLTGVSMFWQSPQAWAAEDSISSWQASYVIDEQGMLEVTEEIVFQFGNSDARGIQRKLMTREPYDEEHDAVYNVTVIDVSSPDAPAMYSESSIGSGRERYRNIRIGDPNRTVGKASATYVIKYQVTGAMRSFSGYDEFYWDALTDLDPRTTNINLTVQVPGGVQDTSCFVGPARSTSPCTSVSVDPNGVARYQQDQKQSADLVTIGAKIGSGLVADNSPHLVPRAAEEDSAGFEPMTMTEGLTAVGATGIVSGLIGWLVTRGRRDERFDGVPPGSIPPDALHAPVAKDNGKAIIPVRFNPPDYPLGHAGYVQDGSLDPEDLSAILVDLAVKGAVQLRMEKKRSRTFVYVRPVDFNRAQFEYERQLMSTLFRGKFVEVALSSPGDLNSTFIMVEKLIAREARDAGLIKRRAPKRGQIRTSSLMPFLVMVGFVLLANAPWLAACLIVICLIAWVVQRKNRGVRSALGRALTDQTEGFREYISTAEADQLRFEEGEDIFSKYLPWAILFGEADRWTQVCRQLIDMGRLEPTVPNWYYGNNFDIAMFRASMLSDALRTASTPKIESPSSSGSGFGGGSSFGGGGFSGGGGGGGGTSSW